jgi:hypothetical protein
LDPVFVDYVTKIFIIECLTDARESLFAGDSNEAKKGNRMLQQQLKMLQELRGYVEKCKQKLEKSASDKKIEKLWFNTRTGLILII